MGVIQAKVPEAEEGRIKSMAERKGYPSVSEYVREALRDKLEEDSLPDEILEEIETAREQVREGKTTGLDEL